MRGARGFVLLNALILVTALAAVGVLLLARASDGQARRFAGQEAAQLQLYLDGFEALALSLLDRDAAGVDHRDEAWAHPVYQVPVDRGTLQGSLHDLQGRFNVNWLANPEDIAAREAFLRLCAPLGISATRAQNIIRFLTPGGTPSQASFSRRVPALDLRGGPVALVDQLQLVPGLRAQEFARLAPHIAALPGDSTLNVNTASSEVLASLLPGVGLAALDQLIRSRSQTPFTSLEGFLTRLGNVGGFDVVGALDGQLFGVNSNWFGASITARLEAASASRLVVLHRQPLPIGARVAYRLRQSN